MFIKINGIKTHYITSGNGENILLLHGWGTSVEPFKGIITLLEKHFCVTALDLPGFGQTDEPKIAFGVDDYVDFILKFISEMKCKKLIILGHSLGGRITIKLSSRKNLPFDISKIILVDSAGIKPKKSVVQKTKQGLYKISKKILMSKAGQKLFPDALENMKNKLGSDDYRNATEIMRQTLVRVVNEDLTPYLSRITAPSTLLIWGENDDATPLCDGQLMEKLIPQSGLAVVKNSGHYPFLEQPYIFNSILKSYLGIK